ncbi:helix-turn-helix transcriptional regulator [Pigmentiphaga aceris]|uniref:Helix-turn-helix transcriptional regulator n=1 Tax=Pigmentiphaga aceris TaxID=1940612 RepID=A0A5C0B227_9BURK|nr:helix-turn-helix transcriptional regulator [Pigmentiphaga aceris]QEI08642.1 helix-turn-helix transcriptional regulator [Pigmentiphaga aceris]
MPVAHEYLLRLSTQLNEGIVHPQRWNEALGSVAELMDAESAVVTEDSPHGAGANDLCLPIETDDGDVMYLSLHRSPDSFAFQPADVARAQGLLPYFRTALRLRHHVRSLQARHHQAACMLDSFDMPALLLDPNGQVLLSNVAGQAWVHSSSSIVGSRRVQDADGIRFRQCLRAACGQGMAPQGAAMQLRATENRPAQYLVLSPVQTETGTLADAAGVASATPMAMLVVRSTASYDNRAGRLFAELFDLTPAETRLLRRLVGGDSLADAARHLNVQMPTVRTHLQAIFRKTDTSRQSELLSLAATLVDTPYAE